MALEFRILGRLEVVDGGRELPLGGAKQRALLAILLVHANEPVSVDVLSEELWGGEPPPTAGKMIQGYVSQLRKQLGEGVILTRSPGYLARVDADELDAGRFERLAADAAGRPPDEAAALLDAALRLWRGAALADFAYEPFAQTEIARLKEARLAALEERIDADLAGGRAALVVSELETLVAEHPFREGLVAQLMLALYRCGRQADALEVYQRARQALDRELGLEPGPSVRELEQQILVHDPALQAPPRRIIVPPRVARQGHRVAIAGALIVAAAAAVAGWELDRGSGPHPTAAGAVIVINPGISPGSIAVARDVGWATNAATNSVSRIDLPTNTRAGTVRVGNSPAGIAAGGGFVWVANSLGGSVTKIDPRGDGGSGGVAETVGVGNGPSGVAFGDRHAWVANSLDRTVSEIVPSSSSASRPIAVPAGADAIAYGFGSIWVVSGSANAVTRIDARSRTVLTQISVGNYPTAVAVGAGSVWVANSLDGTVSKIDPNTGTVVDVVLVGGSASSIAAGSGAVWVGDPRLATLTRIDPDLDKVVQTVHTTNPPRGLAMSAGRLYATLGAPSSAHRGGTLRVLLPEDPFDSIDPAVASMSSSWSALSVTNDGLVTYQRVGGTNGIRIVPDLATSLPAISDGGRTYAFQVRPGIHYSNGTLVRPADFRRAIERALQYQSLKPPLGVGLYFEQIVGAADCVKMPRRCDLRKGIVTDPSVRTVTFHLTQPDSDFLDKLALPAADAVPADTPFKARLPLPATGSYMIASYEAARGATFVRNPRFHEWSAAAQPLGYPAKIVYTFNKPESASVNAVEHGVSDYTLLAPDATAALRRGGYGSQMHSNPWLATYYFFLNTTMVPFNRVDVRRAVNYAVDRARLARLYAAGTGLTGQPTCQVLPPNSAGYVRSCLYPYDLARAKRLVAQSGTTGRAVTVSAGPPGLKASAYLVSVLNSLGYKARLEAYKTVDAYHAARDRGEVEIGPTGWGADFPAPSDFFNLPLTCKTALNPAFNLAAFCDPRIDREIERARAIATGDPQTAAVAWSRIDRDVMQEAPWIPIANGAQADLISRHVGNYQFNPFWGVLFDQLWVR